MAAQKLGGGANTAAVSAAAQTSVVDLALNSLEDASLDPGQLKKFGGLVENIRTLRLVSGGPGSTDPGKEMDWYRAQLSAPQANPTEVALEALWKFVRTPEQREELLALAARYEGPDDKPLAFGPLEILPCRYEDPRRVVGPHDAFVFSAREGRTISLDRFLEDNLGQKNAAELQRALAEVVRFNEDVAATTQVALFVDSNHKARTPLGRTGSEMTSQEEDLAAAGMRFADGKSALVICALVVKKAKDLGLDFSIPSNMWRECQPDVFGKLEEGEFELLRILKSGYVRFDGGCSVLHVDESGCLQTAADCKYAAPSTWALGERL